MINGPSFRRLRSAAFPLPFFTVRANTRQKRQDENLLNAKSFPGLRFFENPLKLCAVPLWSGEQ